MLLNVLVSALLRIPTEPVRFVPSAVNTQTGSPLYDQGRIYTFIVSLSYVIFTNHSLLWVLKVSGALVKSAVASVLLVLPFLSSN